MLSLNYNSAQCCRRSHETYNSVSHNILIVKAYRNGYKPIKQYHTAISATGSLIISRDRYIVNLLYSSVTVY